MKKPSVTTVKKYLSAITRIKAKYITAERLSKEVGIYPEKIAEELSYFEPMLTMDYSYNLLALVPEMKKFVSDDSNKKEVKQVEEVVTKKKLAQNSSINDFVYKKLTIPGSGLIDRNAYLSDADLRALKRLISEEQERRKK